MWIKHYGPTARMSGGAPAALTHGQPYVIMGSGFGTKATAAPVIWDSFDGGSDGDIIPTSTGWTDEGVEWQVAGKEPHYSTTRLHTPGGLACKIRSHCSDSLIDHYPCWDAGGLGLGLTEAYLSYWVYLDHLSGAESHNIKLARLANVLAGDWHSGQPFFGATRNGTAATDWNFYYHNGTALVGAYDTAGTLTEGAWHHVEQAIRLSAPAGTANGTRSSRIDGVRLWTPPDTGHLTLDVAPDNPSFHHLWLAGMCGDNGEPWSYDIYYDDVYLDADQARVVLGDAATFDGCTVQEVQPWTAWADSEITVTVNRGSLPSGAAYLYVVDADGLAQAARPVTVV